MAERTVTQYVVPNAVSMRFYLRQPNLYQVVPEQGSGPGDNHGTCVASIAGAEGFGAAQKADIHLIKLQGNYRKLNNPTNQNVLFDGGENLNAIMDGLGYIRRDVTNNQTPKRGKAVVNISRG